MLKSNFFKTIIAILTISMFITACDKDDDPINDKPGNNDGDPTTTEKVKTVKDVDVKDYTKWHYFSFAENEVIGSGEADPAKGDDAKWHDRKDWDIAFHRNNIRTNSGLSGVGNSGVCLTETEKIEDVKEVPANATFYIDEKAISFMAKSDMPPQFIESNLNIAMNKWVDYNHEEGIWKFYKKNVFLIRTADGKRYVKFKLVKFHNDKDESGHMTFKYQMTEPGSTSFE